MEYCKNISMGNFGGVKATVGITTGYCFSGLVGGVSRCEYTTHGPLVNLAARLMVASERDALVDTATKDRCLSSSHAQIEFDAMPAIKVKGREEPVPIFVPRKVAKVRARVIARSNSSLALGASSPRPGTTLLACCFVAFNLVALSQTFSLAQLALSRAEVTRRQDPAQQPRSLSAALPRVCRASGSATEDGRPGAGQFDAALSPALFRR